MIISPYNSMNPVLDARENAEWRGSAILDLHA
jgi:hypothetical protein